MAERFVLARPRGGRAAGERRRRGQMADPLSAGRRGRERCSFPDVGRSGALCVSSQVGCTLNCTFCHTGTQALVRNLTAAEIVAQVQVARDDLGEWMAPEGARRLTNIVFMGMGEPLYNLDGVADALDVISDNEGIAISRRRVTVSTSGVVPQIRALGRAHQRPCWRSRCTPPTTPCATNWSRSTAAIRSPTCSAAVRDYPRPQQRPPRHLRICHAQGCQRQPG